MRLPGAGERGACRGQSGLVHCLPGNPRDAGEGPGRASVIWHATNGHRARASPGRAMRVGSSAAASSTAVLPDRHALARQLPTARGGRVAADPGSRCPGPDVLLVTKLPGCRLTGRTGTAPRPRAGRTAVPGGRPRKIPPACARSGDAVSAHLGGARRPVHRHRSRPTLLRGSFVLEPGAVARRPDRARTRSA